MLAALPRAANCFLATVRSQSPAEGLDPAGLGLQQESGAATCSLQEVLAVCVRPEVAEEVKMPSGSIVTEILQHQEPKPSTAGAEYGNALRGKGCAGDS